MRPAKDFFRPLAVGAPAPVTEIPARPSRAIHFFDPSNEKMAAKIPAMVGTVDVLLGNLEDAVKADNKLAAREAITLEETDKLPERVFRAAAPRILPHIPERKPPPVVVTGPVEPTPPIPAPAGRHITRGTWIAGGVAAGALVGSTLER